MRIVNRTSTGLATELTEKKARAMAIITATVKVVRAEFVTDLPGQEMLYLRKENEARAFLAEPVTPTDLTPYKFIAAEVGITGTTAAQVAQVYLNLAVIWEDVGSQLETVRLGAVAAVEAATAPAAVDAAMYEFFTNMGVFS